MVQDFFAVLVNGRGEVFVVAHLFVNGRESREVIFFGKVQSGGGILFGS